jgi:hypothetical protein
MTRSATITNCGTPIVAIFKNWIFVKFYFKHETFWKAAIGTHLLEIVLHKIIVTT